MISPLDDSHRESWHFDTSHIGRRVLVYDVTDSTNTRAAELAGDPANAGVVVLAHAQTAGRGQYGRSWHTPPGSSVLMSVLLFPPPELRRPAILIAWAAVAVSAVIRHTTGLQARIKWPNDLLVQGRKVCGILTECVQRGGEGNRSHFAAIAGIGLNVNQAPADFECLGLPTASSLAAESGRSWEMHGIVEKIIRELDAEYDRLLRGDLAALEARWTERIGLIGKPIVVKCADGSSFRGRLREMTFDHLELLGPDGPALQVSPEMIRHLTEAE
jgi:BirA family transcriptional regulator, biotin operon repressor / biotin---[acetyl-CoA-carboxylase] ligase